MFTYSSYDALVQVDDTPLWVRLSAVQAIHGMDDGRTAILLGGGRAVHTHVLAEEIITKFGKAIKP